jgi:hypothetical protein
VRDDRNRNIDTQDTKDTDMDTLLIRSYGFATYLLGRGFTLLGAEVTSPGLVSYRFAPLPGVTAHRDYAASKDQLNALADAVLASGNTRDTGGAR